MYKKLLTPENVYAIDNVNNTKAIKETVSNHIELDASITSNKKGFSYFHELFVIRHKKILTDAIKIQSLVILVVIGFSKFFLSKNFLNASTSSSTDVSSFLTTISSR